MDGGAFFQRGGAARSGARAGRGLMFPRRARRPPKARRALGAQAPLRSASPRIGERAPTPVKMRVRWEGPVEDAAGRGSDATASTRSESDFLALHQPASRTRAISAASFVPLRTLRAVGMVSPWRRPNGRAVPLERGSAAGAGEQAFSRLPGLDRRHKPARRPRISSVRSQLA